MTDDPKVMEFWSSRKPKESGEVRTTKENMHQLWINGHIVFESKIIKNRRSISEDGTVALAAVADDEPSSSQEENSDALPTPSSIWLVDKSGHKKKISPVSVDCSFPLISPDSSMVAFTGDPVISGGISAPTLLYVLDVKTGKYRTFGNKQCLDHYSITPVEWIDGNKALNVIEEHGETGGHMVMRKISLEG